MTYQPHVPPAPQKQGMSTGKKIALFGCLPITVIGLLIVGGCAAMVGGAAHEVDKSIKADAKEDKRAAAQDVALTSCKIVNSPLGRELKAKVKITNHGKKRANYLVEGEFLNQKGNQVSDLTATAENLAPGSATGDLEFGGALISSDQLAGVTKGTCKILKVSRDEWSAAN